MARSAYEPYRPARRPGSRPPGEDAPRYRVLVHRRQVDLWERLPSVVGLESAQQFWDHVAFTPGEPPAINRTCILRGRAGEPEADGFSRTVHYEISAAGRIDYQFNDAYTGGTHGDPHPVVRIRAIDLSSH